MKDIEIICIDDCSNNNSLEILLKLAPFDKRIRVVSLNKNYGTCRASTLKKAFRHISDEYLIKAEDAYSYFITAYYAKSYYGVNFKHGLYNYHLGIGITGRIDLSLQHLDLYCQNMCSWNSLNRFIRSHNLPYYRKIFLPRFRIKLLLDCLSKFYVYLPEPLQEEGLDILHNYWTKDELEQGFSLINCIHLTKLYI